MKILLLDWKAFGNEEIYNAFTSLGHEVIRFPFPSEEPRHNPVFEAALEKEIEKQHPDFIFSFNYFPVVSIVCKKAGVKYASWIYDSPYVLMYAYQIIFDCNYVFVFDKELYLEFHRNNINTVYYLPLAADAKKLSQMTDIMSFKKSASANKADIAFVGQLYTEKHQFFQRMEGISDYTRGYLEGIMAAQKQVFGFNFVKDMLSADILEDMHKYLPLDTNPEGVETREYLYSQYVINRQLTAIERTELLSAIGEHHSFDLYTVDPTLKLHGCINHGKVDPIDTAPYVYKCAKINLNISLRSITSGIPLRCFDILGSEGFLISNYQADFDDCYIANEDYVYYDSKDDLLAKIDYYLNHEDERREIAHNGFVRTLENHTFEHRALEIISILFPEE